MRDEQRGTRKKIRTKGFSKPLAIQSKGRPCWRGESRPPPPYGRKRREERASERQETGLTLSPRGKGEKPDHRILAKSFVGHNPSRVTVQLMIQKIPDINGKTCTVLWDTGAQISLITYQYVKEAGFKALCCCVEPCSRSILLFLEQEKQRHNNK